MADNPFWHTLRDAIFTPHLDEATLQARVAELRQQLPVPVFWLLGKAQSGKTSIIRTLTGRTDAEIGNGFQPCTQTSRLYEFPLPEQPLIHFLDTRGLGEVSYDPNHDLTLFARQSHVLIVVMRVMDHSQQSVIKAVQDIRRYRPQWPIVVVQTCLHDGYSTREMEHLQPYPYDQVPLPPAIPQDVRRSLHTQRTLFKDMPARFVAVDFTQSEDGYTPTDYGLDALWHSLETALPLGLRQMLLQDSYQDAALRDLYAQTAHPHIISYALLAGTAGAIPVPLASTPLVLALQAKLCQTLSSIYNQEMNRERFMEIGSTLGIGYGASLLGRELLKLVPIYGSAVSAAYTASITYALGQTLCVYFSYIRQGHLPDQKLFETVYNTELERGRDVLKRYLAAMQQKSVEEKAKSG